MFVQRNLRYTCAVAAIIFLLLISQCDCVKKKSKIQRVKKFDPAERIVELREDRMFKAETLKAPLVVAYFYTRKCLSCPEFSKKFEEVVKKLKDVQEVHFVKVESHEFTVTAKRNGVKYYPSVFFYNNKRDGEILYEGRQDVASLYAAIDEELKYEMPRLISVQSNDYTQLVFDRNADVVMLFLQQGCRGCLRAEKDMIDLMKEYQEQFGEHKVRFLKNDASVSKVLARIYDVLEYPSVWLFPRLYKEGVSHKGIYNRTFMSQLMDFHFMYTDNWDSDTFGLRGRNLQIETIVAPQLDFLRKGDVMPSEIEVINNKLRAMFNQQQRKFYMTALESFLPDRDGLKAIERRQSVVAQKIAANFEKKKHDYDDNEKLINEWNVLQFYKDYQHDIPELRKKVKGSKKMEL